MGIDLTHVPYKGAAPSLIDLMAGQVQVLLVSLTSVESQMQSGRLRAIGVSSPQRSSFLPNLPAIAETLPGYDIGTWHGVLAPAGSAWDGATSAVLRGGARIGWDLGREARVRAAYAEAAQARADRRRRAIASCAIEEVSIPVTGDAIAPLAEYFRRRARAR